MSDPFTKKNIFPRIKNSRIKSNSPFNNLFKLKFKKKILVVVEKVSFCEYLNGLFHTIAHYTFPAN